MNSCLYGNGTSFVESLFEDFGECDPQCVLFVMNVFFCNLSGGYHGIENYIYIMYINIKVITVQYFFLHVLSVNPGKHY